MYSIYRPFIVLNISIMQFSKNLHQTCGILFKGFSVPKGALYVCMNDVEARTAIKVLVLYSFSNCGTGHIDLTSK